ncbi:MAG: helix-turn-helix domain-containing protein [Clostridiales bacterium]|nr:helix-turn-helix domain-containing protein [Clostridiales bacterium]
MPLRLLPPQPDHPQPAGRTGGEEPAAQRKTHPHGPAHHPGKADVLFSAEAQRRGGYEFDIPFSRQQLADYLGVERSGLSLELGKMRDEGLLDFHKSHFLLKAPETDGLPPSAR